MKAGRKPESAGSLRKKLELASTNLAEADELLGRSNEPGDASDRTLMRAGARERLAAASALLGEVGQATEEPPEPPRARFGWCGVGTIGMLPWLLAGLGPMRQRAGRLANSR